MRRLLILLQLVLFLALAAACAKVPSANVVSSSGLQPSDVHAEIYELWSASDSTVAFRVQYRHGDANGDLLTVDNGDSLVVDDVNPLVAAPDTSTVPSGADDFGPTGPNYRVTTSAPTNTGHTLAWKRNGLALATTQLPPTTAAAFKSYEYCHAVSGPNYVLIRYVGDAPAANDSICATLSATCSPDACADMHSCTVEDFRVRFDDLPDGLAPPTTVTAKIVRDVVTDQPGGGYNGGHLTQRYDTGSIAAADDGFCLKP